MLKSINLLKNVGRFETFSGTGVTDNLPKGLLFYGENGKGKTTITAVLRSLGTGNPLPILERKRLGAEDDPHIVFKTDDGLSLIFQNGQWGNGSFGVCVFDDDFVDKNVYSGLSVGSETRQSLHGLVIGEQGVLLSQQVIDSGQCIEEHNMAIRTITQQVPNSILAGEAFEGFYSLQNEDQVSEKIEALQKRWLVLQESHKIKKADKFQKFSIPKVPIEATSQALELTLEDLDASAVTRLKTHFSKLGQSGEEWASQGYTLADESQGEECPFCLSPLKDNPILGHYRAYFSQAYDDLKQSIQQTISLLEQNNNTYVMTAFEREVRIVRDLVAFWSKYGEFSGFDIDTAEVVRDWTQVKERLSVALSEKSKSPLEKQSLTDDAASSFLFEKLKGHIQVLESFNRVLEKYNTQIDQIKENADAENLESIQSEIRRLQRIKNRFSDEYVEICCQYANARKLKDAEEANKKSLRERLNQYQEKIFPQYETAINRYLLGFNASFSIEKMKPSSIRSGNTCSYQIKILDTPVSLIPKEEGEAHFGNTLSAGDRNTLALAFFFALLENDPNLSSKVVVIDDPMTSLDDHRRVNTALEVGKLFPKVNQLIVLSHCKQFACSVWNNIHTNKEQNIAAFQMQRVTRDTSKVALWDVHSECYTEYDNRKRKLRDYLQDGSACDSRVVAESIRPVLEGFCRVAYAEDFPPGTLLGTFINSAKNKGLTHSAINSDDLEELEHLKNYGNRFHHDTNPAYQTETINETELDGFVSRTLNFTTRPVSI
jgi:wobble nucleotide-excising tRNase